MQVEGEPTESLLVEATADDLEGGGLLGDEEDPLASREAFRKQVGDGLALAGAGRALEDKRASLGSAGHGGKLG